jgi:hypothetical protein
MLSAFLLTVVQLPDPTFAQEQNCFAYIKNNVVPSGSYFFRAVQGTAIVSNAILLASGADGVLVLNKGVVGNVNIQYAANVNFTPIIGTFMTWHATNCTDNNNEYADQCGKLGIDFSDLATAPSASIKLTVFDKNGNSVFTGNYSGSTLFTINQVLPAALDSNASYTYELRCIGGPCIAGNRFLNGGDLIYAGPLTYVCPSPCGPGTAGAPLGRMVTTVPLYASPNSAPSTFLAEAGKTFKMLGTSSGFTNIALACNSYWVPSEAIVQCADPLCLD